MRKITEVTTIKQVRRDGRTYEFGQTVEPGFVNGEGKYWGELRTTWARVHNGYEWRSLHYIITEH